MYSSSNIIAANKSRWAGHSLQHALGDKVVVVDLMYSAVRSLAVPNITLPASVASRVFQQETANMFTSGHQTIPSIPSLEDQGLLSVWPLRFDLSGLGGPTSTALCVTGAHKPPHHFDVAVYRVQVVIYAYKILVGEPQRKRPLQRSIR